MGGAPLVRAQTSPVSVGVNASFQQNYARAANIGWSRVDITWSIVEPTQGTFSWSTIDSEVNGAIANGQQVLGILHVVPQWAGGGTLGNTPPTTTTDWATYVGQVAKRYKGKIAAYEVWNEPDLHGSSTQGVGWDRSVNQPPEYIDFVHTAAEQIRAQAPGTLVVGPVFSSSNTGSGSASARESIMKQIQQSNYSDGAGPTFLDVTSYHGNAFDNDDSLTMAEALYYMNLSYLTFAPSLASKPVWVTEFGWRINAVGQDCQRQFTCEYLRYLTRSWDTADTMLTPYNITRAFFWTLIDPTNQTSQILFGPTGNPSETVSQYLQLLAYPAVQNPVVNGDTDYPSCYGPSGEDCGSSGTADVLKSAALADDWTALGAPLGLSDPRPALPAGFSTRRARQMPGGLGFSTVFADSQDGRIEVTAARFGDAAAPNYLTDRGASWMKGGARITISGWRGMQALGRDEVAELAAALDPAFAQACVAETATADAADLAALGLHAPAPPAGYSSKDSSLQITRLVGDCTRGQTAPKTYDLSWWFAGHNGQVIRAGVYNFGTSPGAKPLETGERSLNWGDASGARYWVAADAGATTPPRSELIQLARSLDPHLEL